MIQDHHLQQLNHNATTSSADRIQNKNLNRVDTEADTQNAFTEDDIHIIDEQDLTDVSSLSSYI